MAIVRLLIAHGAETSLRSASILGDVEAVQRLVLPGSHVDWKDKRGRPVLNWAAEKGHADVVRVLLDGGAKTNLRAKDGRSVLDYAFEGGQRQAFVQLVEAGAKKTKSDGAKDWLKRDRRFANAGRNARIMAFVWLILFLGALRAPSNRSSPPMAGF